MMRWHVTPTTAICQLKWPKKRIGVEVNFILDSSDKKYWELNLIKVKVIVTLEGLFKNV